MGSRKRERYLENHRRRRELESLTRRMEENSAASQDRYEDEGLKVLFGAQVETMVSAVFRDLDEGDLDIAWDVRPVTDDDVRAYPAPTLRGSADILKKTSLWTVDFLRSGQTHSICTINLSHTGEATRRIVAAAQELVLEETGELRPRCPKHIHHVLGCETRTVLTQMSEDSHMSQTSVVWSCPSDNTLTCEVGTYSQWRDALEDS